MRRTLLLLCCFLGAAAALVGTEVSAGVGARNGGIAFTHSTAIGLTGQGGCTKEAGCPRDTSFVAQVSARGGKPRRIRTCKRPPPCESAEPASSRTGRRLAFVQDGTIVIARPDGERVRTLKRPADIVSLSEPTWSPTGSHLAVTGVRDVEEQVEPSVVRIDHEMAIYVIRADGHGGLRGLTSGPYDSGAAWSASGRIVFQRGRSLEDAEDVDLFTVNPSGTRLRQITFRGGETPDWSPDGAQIAFARGADGNENIHVIGLDGRGLRRLTRAGDSREPVWSPDGRRLAYVHDGGIYILRLRGRTRHRVFQAPGEDSLFSPDWMPRLRRR